LGNLQIAAAMSRPRPYGELAPVAEDCDGKLAILGLDFGTAFTKAVVRWGGRHYAVNWSDVVEGDAPHLLASVFSEAPDGRCMLGAQEEWSVREGIKLRLVSAGDSASNEIRADAVIFIALAFRHVDRWLRRTCHVDSKGIRWRLHVGLPTSSWDVNATAATFRAVADAARTLACMPGQVTRRGAIQSLSMTDQADRPAVDVFPEFACQLYSYLLSPERGDDMHVLVDIGAGTLDVAYFNVFRANDEDQLPIWSSEVERLGAHYLIAALSGATGSPAWTDRESALSDEAVAQKLGCAVVDVGQRRCLYLNCVATVFHKATCAAMEAYPRSPAIMGGQRVRLFLCGGGSRIPAIQERFERIAREAPGVTRINYQISPLVKPSNMISVVDTEFDRLSVAYGLSQNAANIGRVKRRSELGAPIPRGRLEERNRDDDR